MDKAKLYHYPNCSTCKRARKWLAAEAIEVELIDIVTSPPSAEVLASAVKASSLPHKRFFNTSGQSYRGGGFRDRLPTMSDVEKLDALANDGKLIKRPLLLRGDLVLVGFKEAEWAALADALRDH